MNKTRQMIYKKMRVEVTLNFIKLISDLGMDPDLLNFKEIEDEGVVNTVFTGITPDLKTPIAEKFENVKGIALLEITPKDLIPLKKTSVLFIKKSEIDSFLDYIESNNMPSDDIDRFLEDDEYQNQIGLSLKGFVLDLNSFTKI